MRRFSLILALTFVVSLVVSVAGAQAIVVNDAGTEAGVALVPGSSLPGSVSTATQASCTDPWLSSDFGGPNLPSDGLCWDGGRVMHGNETFDLAWDPLRRDWATTRDYVEQFLKDVADGSHTLTSPYAVTTEYRDGISDPNSPADSSGAANTTGRAENASVYGGGCIDYGSAGGSTCEFGDTSADGPGTGYPANVCTPGGTNQFSEGPGGTFGPFNANDVCLTDAQIKDYLSAMIPQEGLSGRTLPGYTPLVVLMTPPGVEVCLDSSNTLCSANSALAPPTPAVSASTSGGTIGAGTYEVEVTYVTASGESLPSSAASVTTTGTTSSITIASPAAGTGVTGWYAYVGNNSTSLTRQQASPTAIGTPVTLDGLTSDGQSPPQNPSTTSFCSYHSHVDVGGTNFAYVVLPWVAQWSSETGCVEPDAPQIPTPTFNTQTLANDAGAQLVSPLSQAHIASIVNPFLNGWFGRDGAEINDNDGCRPFGNDLDEVTVGTGSQNPYFLQREFNNGGVIETDPNALACTPDVSLEPQFVVPSAVEPGDVVEFDGSKTVSTLLVPRANYAWNFGDGTTATGPSVEHSYAQGGTYTVTLKVTDRGGNVATLAQTIQILGSNGQPVNANGGGTSGTNGTNGTTNNKHGFKVRILLMPQALKTVLRHGLMARITSNERAAGIATVSISRREAKRAHIKLGRGPSVVIGVGTISGIKHGTMSLHLRLSRTVAAKLKRLGHVTLTVRLALVAADGGRVAIDAAGRY